MPLPLVGTFPSAAVSHAHHGHHRESKTIAQGSSVTGAGAIVSQTAIVAVGTSSKQCVASHHQSAQLSQYSNNFCEVYEHLCAMQNQMPLQTVKSSVSNGEAGLCLHLNADRLKSASSAFFVYFCQ